MLEFEPFFQSSASEPILTSWTTCCWKRWANEVILGMSLRIWKSTNMFIKSHNMESIAGFIDTASPDKGITVHVLGYCHFTGTQWPWNGIYGRHSSTGWQHKTTPNKYHWHQNNLRSVNNHLKTNGKSLYWISTEVFFKVIFNCATFFLNWIEHFLFEQCQNILSTQQVLGTGFSLFGGQ